MDANRPEDRWMKCRRCDGKGSIEFYSHVGGGKCFSCQGAGEVITPACAKAQEAWDAAAHEAATVHILDVKVGDVLARGTVTRVVRRCSRKIDGPDRSDRPYAIERLFVEFDDGSVAKVSVADIPEDYRFDR